MKRSAAFTLAFCGLAICSYAQQIDPGNVHSDDKASFGNRRPSKQEKTPTTRTVTGQVTDKTGQVLEGALVTLTDRKTNEKTSFFTKKDGRYQFAELNFMRDYDVQARYKDKSSEPRKLSQFDRAPKPVRILEIEETVAVAAPASGATAQSAAPPKR